MQSQIEEIPRLSLLDIESQGACAQLKLALSEFGFVAIFDHGLSSEFRQLAFEQVAQFFALAPEEKQKYHQVGGGGARGYTPFGVEKAKDQVTADLKEFYHVGRQELQLTSDLARPTPQDRVAVARLPKNIWPTNLPSFKPTLLEMYRKLDAIGARVLSAIAASLGLESHYFEDKCAAGNSLLRALHYPALRQFAGSAVRASAHEDINLITLLVGSNQPGLEVLSKTGRWIEAPLGDELIICNVGDMLERLTNNVLSSTTHRVVNPQGIWANQARFSLPFFVHLNSDFLISSLPGCVNLKNPDHYPDAILADDFLKQRLVEIGLL